MKFKAHLFITFDFESPVPGPGYTTTDPRECAAVDKRQIENTPIEFLHLVTKEMKVDASVWALDEGGMWREAGGPLLDHRGAVS